MKRKLSALPGRYLAALRKHLKQGPQASLQPARVLGRQAVALGLETLDVARIHEEALATLEASGSQRAINVRLLTVKRAAGLHDHSLQKRIANTQRLVDMSVKTIARFAREHRKHQPV